MELIIQAADVHPDKNGKATHSQCPLKVLGRLASGEFQGRMSGNRTLITVMNLSRELVKAWHSCGLSRNSFWLGAARPFIISGTMQRVVGSMIKNMRGAHPSEGGHGGCVVPEQTGN